MLRSIFHVVCHDTALAARLWPQEANDPERQVNLLDGFNGRFIVPIEVEYVLAVIAKHRSPFVVYVDPEATSGP